MAELKKCRTCGVDIPSNAPSGHCPKCLLELGFGAGAEDALKFPDDVAPDAQPTATAATPFAEEPGDYIDRYKLLQKIGEGGCGVVYMADQEEPIHRRVALKVIKLGMDTRAVVARFEAERQALAMMDHPNIAKVLDVGQTPTGRPFFVMELVKGVPITDYCDQNNLPTRERLDLFMQVCHAIQHAHQKGIIHRDVKPSNILVTLHDGVPVPKVIDFGIAKAMNQQRLTDLTLFTAFGQFVGTPAYMSPEQAEMSGLDVDTRSDIYSLGVLLYELLVGRTPFDGKKLLQAGLDAIRRIILEQEPPRPSTRLSTLAAAEQTTVAQQRQTEAIKLIRLLLGDLDWIVMMCLEKDRTRRYETANGLAADLRRHLNHEPVIARPPTAAYKFQKAYRRHKLGFTAATAVAVALVVGIGLSSWQMLRATRAEREQNNLRQVAVKALGGEKEQRFRANAQALKASESEQQSRRLLYASDMYLAQQALKENNLGRARRALDRHRPQPGEEDLRGWEWRYLWQLTRSSALVTLTNQLTRGFSVSFSPDGTRLAVGWFDGRVELWDVLERRLVRALTDREYPHQGHVAFSPVRNLLAATSEPRVVALYDLDSDQVSILWRAPDNGAWNVRDMAFSPDGSRLVIYAGSTSSNRGLGNAVWVVNVSSSQIESRHPTDYTSTSHHGAARLSPDNRRLYLPRSGDSNSTYRIRCLDLVTGQELWQTEPQRDMGLTALALSPDGRVLASGSGLGDSAIRIWDAATGRPIARLDGHTAFVCELAFTQNGQRLISGAADQTIRIWDTGNWTEMKVLRGHTDEIHALAISEPAQLIASSGKDGNLMLWKEDGTSTTDGYRRLPGNLDANQVLPLDHSRVLMLQPGRRPALIDLKRDSPPESLPQIRFSADVLGWFGSNMLCHWNGTNQILIRELRDAELAPHGAITVDSGRRPAAVAFNPARQLLAWSERTSPDLVYVTNLTAASNRVELKGDVPGLVPSRFSENGDYLIAARGLDILRVWNVETRQIVVSINERVRGAAFAASERVLVINIEQNNDHEIGFYDLTHPEQTSRRVHGRHYAPALAVAPDGRLAASSTYGGEVRLFDPVKGEWLEDIHGHLNAALGVAFSPDGRRLISTYGGKEAVKLWDVTTRQELLTLGGIGATLPAARWSADGDVILAGPPWQAWRAPTWEEIAAAEAKEKTDGKRP